ncbi:putative lipoprotein [Ensifer adhaerens]|uniref:Lipoprotein n=1 Tax=Ensifer adhaerens TaxID=106592 RepID=A0ACC5SQL7_ENSAD|nr:imelysin family protein [Ensifer adhaerens]MBP1871177.1 putative lipoprotein [Ensifer adhaerens]
MSPMPSLAFGLALTALSLPAMAQEGSALSPRVVNEAAVPAVMAKAVDDFIIPGYRNLSDKTAALTKASAALCETPSAASREKAKAAFSELVEAWSTVEIIRLGPALEQNRFERFLFYPDRKSTGLKQVQAILAKKDETATDVASLKGKSVAAQGLGALEYVLYGNGSEVLASKEGDFRCRYGVAIAQNLNMIANEFLAEWQKPDGIQAAWKKPGPGNPEFRDSKEAATELLGIFVHGVEMVKDQRLKPFYAGTVDGASDKGHPKSAIYWRSQNTMPSIAANFAGLKTLFDVADMESLLPEDSRSVAGSADFVFKSVIGISQTIDGPIADAIADDKSRAKLDFLTLNTADLLGRLNRDFGGAIGLGAGFSFADGD